MSNKTTIPQSTKIGNRNQGSRTGGIQRDPEQSPYGPKKEHNTHGRPEWKDPRRIT